MKKKIFYLFILLPVLVISCNKSEATPLPLPGVYILVNQVGYNTKGWKHAVISAKKKLNIYSFKLINAKKEKVVYNSKVHYKGSVDHWKNWKFWTLDFSNFSGSGIFYLKINTNKGYARSYQFKINKNILERYTLS